MTVIEGGNTANSKATVNARGELYVHATSTDEADEATKTGRSFNINTKDVTLTNATNTPVLYFKNNESEDFHMTALAVGLQGSTDGDANVLCRITVVRNPTAGTIISSPTVVSINGNRNYGSADTMDSDVYVGATGDTMTGGGDQLYFYQATKGRLFAPIDEVIPKGSTLGVEIQAPDSNTSLTCYVALIGHLEDSKA